MNSLKDTDLKQYKAIEWPRQLTTPAELIQSIKQRTKLQQLIKSPICSKIVLQLVGSWAYLLAHVLNQTRVFNIDIFNKELKRIEAQQAACNNSGLLSPPDELGQNKNVVTSLSSSQTGPLLSYSNHISCIDDPVLWASLLPLTYYSTRTDSVRWSAAAVEICFSKPWHSTFFSLGKTFPIIRGIGINQPAMEFAMALLNYNQWLHLFPEGRVMRDDKQQIISNKERGYIFKWGISKLILDYFNTPTIDDTKASEKRIRILPFYHLGLDDILPIGWPYIPKIGKRITILVKPSVIEMNSKLLSDILTNQPIQPSTTSKSRSSDEIKRKRLTNYLEQELEKLAEPATKLHLQDR